MKNKYTTNMIAYDSFIATITIVLLMISTSITSSWKYLSFIVVIVFTVIYNNSKNVRPIVTGLVIIFISFLLTNVLNVIVFLIPNVVLACVCAFIYKSKYKYLIPIFILVNLFIEWSLHAYLYFNKSLPQFIIDILLGVNSESKLAILIVDIKVFYVFFLFFIIIITIFESLLYFFVCNAIIRK